MLHEVGESKFIRPLFHYKWCPSPKFGNVWGKCLSFEKLNQENCSFLPCYTYKYIFLIKITFMPRLGWGLSSSISTIVITTAMFRGDTNKKQVLMFIVESIRDILPSLYSNESQLFAHVALWEFVGMLVKQNGVSCSYRIVHLFGRMGVDSINNTRAI